MSEENKDLGDKAEEAFDDAKNAAEEAADNIAEEASEIADEAGEAVDDAADAVSDKASEIKEEAKEMYEDAKEAAKKAADKAGEKASQLKEDAKEVFEDVKEEAKEFVDDAKEAAKDFKENVEEMVSGDENKKVLAGVLAIILGSLGVHKFILGYNKEGFILLGASIAAYLLSCLAIGLLFIWIPGLIGLIEGIIYLTKSDEEFYNTYQVGKKPWF